MLRRAFLIYRLAGNLKQGISILRTAPEWSDVSNAEITLRSSNTYRNIRQGFLDVIHHHQGYKP